MSGDGFATALPGLLLAVALAGRGAQAGSDATSPAVVPTPEPIPVVEPSCVADSFQVASTASRDHEMRPGVSTGTAPAVNPRCGVPQGEIDEIPGIPSTALSVIVTEVNHNTCTTRPLPVGEDTDLDVATIDDLTAAVAAQAPRDRPPVPALLRRRPDADRPVADERGLPAPA